MVKSLTDLAVALLLASCLITFQSQSPSLAQAQDILRQRQQNSPTNSNNNNDNNNLNPLASIQLPPELASLTPQQLHQLAQLRELQIQQQAAQQQQGNNNNQAANAPAPIGAETLPTTQPSASNNAQIPQPNAASSLTTTGSSSSNQSGFQTNNDSNDRHDDGAYNESGSEMEGVMQSGNEASGSSSSPSSSSASATSGNSAATPASPTFEVNWNKCPQLEPSESEKSKKTQVITKCLQSAPIPTNLTRENVETHREQIATCALKVEGWFDDQGNYKYDKAESEIRGKKLEPSIELQVLKFHVACKDEASKKFSRDQNKLIDQVQFYQACMDYYISIVCEIEVSVDQ